MLQNGTTVALRDIVGNDRKDETTMANLNLTAEQAIERSEEHNEIVTIEGSEEIHNTLRVECDDSVEHYVDHEDGYTLTEYWKNDPNSEDGMLWRVHVRDNDPVE